MERHTRIINFSWERILIALMTFLVTAEVHILILSGSAQAEGNIHHLDFILEEKNYTRLCATKSMLVVNGMFPGPTIRVRKGDTVYVNAINRGPYGVTLHWHGVMQPRNSWSDGPEYITQCAIQPGTNFTYEIDFSTEEGTVWWHAHSDWTRSSVHGAIVVHPSEGTTYPFPEPDGEEVLVLGSWYTGDVNEMVQADLKAGDDLPDSEAYTINGQPGDFCPCSSDSTYRWHVDYGKTYLLRILNADMNAELFMAIAGHNITIVGSDGAYVKPFVTNYIMISPGRTIDALLTANQTPSHYYIVARQYNSGIISYKVFDHTNASAILQYNGNYTAPDKPEFPTTLPSYYAIDATVNFTMQFRSLADEDHAIDVPLNITTRMFITASVNELGEKSYLRMSSSFNNISWVNPPVDVLTAYYRNMSGYYTSDFPDEPPAFFDFTGMLSANTSASDFGTRVKVLNYGEEVEIVFQGTNVINASINHPMHLHGYTFYVVGQGQGNFDGEKDPKTYNLVDPPQLNTISSPKNGWVTLRFKADNPGVWLLHCHLDRHLSWGMNTVLIVKNGPTAETSLREPPANMPSCAIESNIKEAVDDKSLTG
ncbi:laccase-14-like isoform X1 [Punica granatum]|uniref:Laccase n=2 Tax=Punica granatum TaxID=22663 RepID=A0A6P8DKP2_PUNGR|nr:laccase-14-like isoform X1 [Punica granatum]